MSSRTQHTARGAWRTTHTAALCPALAVLLAALVICLGPAAHAASGDHVTAMTGVSHAQIQTGSPAEHHVMPAAHPGGCPSGDVCCSPAVHGAAAVLAAPVHSLPVLLPRMPSVPRRQAGPTLLAKPPPASSAPDLHVLQVQRT
ncbi:hypothetical protein SMIR_36205 [Streptomyces mirabilis]|uniref:hypothetical protein n=1 Tax=Streptomyces mirabilis TaxID=68239 RepID=UPI001BB085A1|nr:hypothetical protein [Streptomyces mirabilis]QUW83938.1 hypothetical protein SMIR_36205 [Streptomyces mirabilis]